MDTKLWNGDHALDGRGLPYLLEDKEELLQRALIRLLIPKGAFARDRALGSELYKLQGAGDSAQRAALAYVQEALADMDELSVEDVEIQALGDGALAVGIRLNANEKSYELQVEVAGA